MAQKTTSQPTFHLGLTMAGAVSAGCYTAGVIDYLIEILDLWQRAKEGKVEGIPKELIPQHNVVIDAMGGASAGGMATIMTALYALEGQVNPVKKVPANPMQSFNVLYDSWVHLNDDTRLTFEKIWDTDDLEGSDAHISSLFNSKVIDAIASKAFTFTEGRMLATQVKGLAPYFSKDLEVLLSHTLLRGIPLEVDFATTKGRKHGPTHTTFEHFLVSHFKLHGGQPVDEDSYMWLNPYADSYARQMQLSTIATGAFPIGLKYRRFDNTQFKKEYIKAVVKRIIHGDFGTENPDDDNLITINGLDDGFESVGVDGGAINNEPYKEVASILKQKSNTEDYGLVMIDPFPDRLDSAPKYKIPGDLIGVVPQIIGTLWDQSKVKRSEVIDQFNGDYQRGVIFPKRYYTDENGKKTTEEEYPIASASFNAFGGFLDVNFRVHDFFLGRNNARNFFRYWFSKPYTEGNKHPIHEGWTKESVKKYEVTIGGVKHLPIIPDLNIVLDNLANPGIQRFHYDVSERPQYDPGALFDLESKMQKRVLTLLKLAKNRTADPKPTMAHATADKWLENHYKSNWFRRLGAWATGVGINGVFAVTVGKLAKVLTKKVVGYILTDLDKKRLLKTPPNK
ncbi:hypothetical protein [uncultured Imperialibacter sp.]|uniref:hypothetical protein n=1 Tax=uncultured Imperialibacter sp. TaxID=1672639 RepID=UPI0030DCBF18